MHAALVDKLELEAELLQAVERQEFTLVYQPIVELDEARIIGFEALLRWIHPTRGVIPPLQFIPLAEQTGVIIPLGRWVLAEACRQGAAWQRTEYGRRAALTMTINISGWQLDHPTFIDDVRTALQSSGLPANNLVLEITESAIIRDYEHVTSRFQALKAIGVRLAIDDFGTGYSSLAYLHRFPVDILKIDKTFVDGVGRGGRDAALARTIIALGDMLSLRTVAEGIEQAEQRSQLQSLGCGLGQGYYFAKPLSAADAEALLSADGEGLLHQAGLNAALTDG
jgi:EAL domain-containing protein (putative c-di-GMP-specific phosphodiesterase class I)